MGWVVVAMARAPYCISASPVECRVRAFDALWTARYEDAHVYPDRYHLPEVTAAVLAALERRRPGFEAWSPAVEAQLAEAAEQVLADMGKQFSEVAVDPAYWGRVESVIRGVALPRYLRVARAQHALERSGYGLWRGGDVVSRVSYGALGLVLAIIVWRAAFLPKWLELLPLALVLFGPLLPDIQSAAARRRYARALDEIIAAMRAEQQHVDTYRPLSDVGDGISTRSPQERERT
jgi:hypothetical protein